MSILNFRPYQQEVFNDRESGVEVLCWSRQIGKSFVLAAWAVDRLLTRPGRLVTVLSNSKDNGSEFALKCAEVCRALGVAMESADYSGIEYDDMRFEISITVKGKKGRMRGGQRRHKRLLRDPNRGRMVHPGRYGRKLHRTRDLRHPCRLDHALWAAQQQ